MTHVIDRYPVELIDIIRLASGQRVRLRPALCQDVELHGTFFGGLSEDSRYNRFFNPTPEVSARTLQHLVRIDHRSRVALLAELISGDNETVIAEARYAAEVGGASAEFALSVADQFQGLGLGKLLLDRLVCAASRAGLDRLVGETLATNDRMLRLARKAGFSVTCDPQFLYLMSLEKRIGATETGHSGQDSNALEARNAA